MGNNQTDSYFTEKPANAAAAFRRHNVYYWILPAHFNTPQGKDCLNTLKEIVKIHPVDSWQSFMSSLDGYTSPSYSRVCLIAPPSLPVLCFASCQSSERIDKIVLLCIDQPPTPAPYPKIAATLHSYAQLVEEVREMEVSERQTLHFFCEQEMQRMNRWMFNWLTLQQGVREKGKAQFLSLMNHLTPGSADLKRYEKTYDLARSEQQRDRMVLQWLKAGNFYLRIPTEFLSKLRDTFSFALVRQPLFDIYNTIRAQYALNNYPEIVAKATLTLNRREVQRLRDGRARFVYFSTFVVAEVEAGKRELEGNEYSFVVRLRRKAMNGGGDCAGFYYNEEAKQVVLNLSNPFQVLHIDHQNREIHLQLVHIIKNDLDFDEGMNNLQLHRRFLRYLIKTIPGQILAAHYNNQLHTYSEFVNSALSFLLSTTSNDLSLRKQLRRIQMAKVKLYFHLQDPRKVEKELLQAKLIQLPKDCNSVPSKIRIYFLLTQLNFRNDFLKFSRCLMRLKELFQAEGKYFTEQQSLKMRVYSIYSFICTNKCQFQENIALLKEIQATSYSKMREDHQVSELYALILLTRAKCEELRGNHNKAYELLDCLIATTKTCQGESEIYFYYHQLKLQLRMRARRSQSQREREQQKQRALSPISLHQLPFSPLPIPLFPVQLQLFEVKEHQSRYFY